MLKRLRFAFLSLLSWLLIWWFWRGATARQLHEYIESMRDVPGMDELERGKMIRALQFLQLADDQRQPRFRACILAWWHACKQR